MKAKRHRQPPINITVRIDDGIPKCPFCHQPYDAAVPLIGGNGVTTTYLHEHEDSVTFHNEFGVLSDDHNDIDYDEMCAYEIGGDVCDVS